jgi:hypothetical protein
VSQDRSHLFRRVKQLFNESPSDLIRRMRVEEGERLLMEGAATVTDGGVRSGIQQPVVLLPLLSGGIRCDPCGLPEPSVRLERLRVARSVPRLFLGLRDAP